MKTAAFQRKEKGNMKGSSSLSPLKALAPPSRKLSAGTTRNALSASCAPFVRSVSPSRTFAPFAVSPSPNQERGTKNQERLPDRTTKAARLYVSPRTRPLNAFEMETRGLSYLLKDHDCPEQAIHVAAREMAALVWGPCNLIPVPGHTGDTAANLRLARAIAGYVAGGATVFDILGRHGPVDSACARHRVGHPPLSIEEHGIIRTSPRLIPCRPTYLVDNVTTSGTTLRACQAALGFGAGLVFADAFHAHT